MTNAENVGTVTHTHTHTQYNLIKEIKAGKNTALFGIYVRDG